MCVSISRASNCIHEPVNKHNWKYILQKYVLHQIILTSALTNFMRIFINSITCIRNEVLLVKLLFQNLLTRKKEILETSLFLNR